VALTNQQRIRKKISREFPGIDPLKRVVRQKEPQQADSVDPPINRAARVGVDPIPLSSSSCHSHFQRRSLPTILRPPCSRAHASIQTLTPASHTLAPPIHVVLLYACALRLSAPFDPERTLATKWRWWRLPSWTRRRCGFGRR
jgi:hypothetical protein